VTISEFKKDFVLQQSRSSMPQCTWLQIAPSCSGLHEEDIMQQPCDQQGEKPIFVGGI
jgi:hypothetical protein